MQSCLINITNEGGERKTETKIQGLQSMFMDKDYGIRYILKDANIINFLIPYVILSVALGTTHLHNFIFY